MSSTTKQRTAKAEAQARIREKQRHYIEELERRELESITLINMLQLAFGMSREDLQEFGDLILERFSSEQQKPDEISKLLDLVKKVRCSIIASSSQFSRRRPSTPVDDHVRKVRILGGTDDNRGTGTKAYRFVLHTPAFQA